MLWIIMVLAFFGGIFRLDSSQHKLRTLASIIIICLVCSWGISRCFNTPVRGDLVRKYDTSGQSLHIYEDAIAFGKCPETIPNRFDDLTLGYTVCQETTDGTSTVEVYEEKYAFLKKLLSFKQPQNMYFVTFSADQLI